MVTSCLTRQDEAVKSKEWIPLDDFLKGSGGTGVLGWIGWGLGKVLGTGSTVNEEVVKEGNYVMVKAVDVGRIYSPWADSC